MKGKTETGVPTRRSFGERMAPVLLGGLSLLLLAVPYLLVVPLARATTALRRRRGRPPRVLYAALPILTVAAAARAERRLGIETDTLVYSTYYITNDFTYDLSQWMQGRIRKQLVKHGVFLWALLRYDVFQFFYDGGLLPVWRTTGFNRAELPLLRCAGKHVVVSAYGADVRVRASTVALGPYTCCTDCPAVMRACICDEALARRNVRFVHRYADRSLSMGDMTLYTPSSRNDVFYWPIDLEAVPFVGAEPHPGPVVIVHAPNHRAYKGTRFLEAAVRTLQEKGLRVELRMIERRPNAEAMQAYAGADIVADQFLVGWHGYFAVEAMALGKPVVCYLRDAKSMLPEGADCPIVAAGPDELPSVLEELVRSPTRRAELGLRGRRYVETIYSLEAFGRRMQDVYREVWGPTE